MVSLSAISLMKFKLYNVKMREEDAVSQWLKHSDISMRRSSNAHIQTLYLSMNESYGLQWVGPIFG